MPDWELITEMLIRQKLDEDTLLKARALYTEAFMECLASGIEPDAARHALIRAAQDSRYAENAAGDNVLVWRTATSDNNLKKRR